MTKPLVPIINEKAVARFWSKVDKSPGQGPNGDCWCWTAFISHDGYPGGLNIDGYKWRSSHVALAIAGQKRPSFDHGALHSCDYPPCVRPEHLRWGTELDNRIDAIARRKHGRSFTPDEVRTIRASSERHCDIARSYGVTQPCIWAIKNGVTHRHVA